MAEIGIYYVEVTHFRSDEPGEVRRPNKRRRLDSDQADAVSLTSSSSPGPIYCLPPSPPISPWTTPAVSPNSSQTSVTTQWPICSSYSFTQLTQRPDLLCAKCEKCDLNLVNVYCVTCKKKFCGGICFDSHKIDQEQDEEEDKIICTGFWAMIPNHDPVPHMDLHFGYAPAKPVPEGRMETETLVPVTAASVAKEEDWDEDARIALQQQGSETPLPVVQLIGQKLIYEEDGPVVTKYREPVRSQKRKDHEKDSDDRIPLTLTYVFNQCVIAGVRLRFQNMGRPRRQVNTSHWDQEKKKIKWTVEFVFEADGMFVKYLRHDVNEDTSVSQSLKELVASNGFQLPEPLSRFRTIGLNEVTLFCFSSNGYSQIESHTDTLKKVIKANNSITEFPTIVIVPKDQGDIVRYQMTDDQ